MVHGTDASTQVL